MQRTTSLAAALAASSTPSLATSARSWAKRALATDGDVAPAIARVALGLVMFPHGAQKALGWFGGPGLGATYGAFTTKMGIPGPLAALAIATELLGALALVFGLGSRLAALGMIGLMLTAIGMVHLPNGFFMNWTGAQHGEGFEFHLLVLALAAIVVVKGGGRASLDRLLSSKA
jgi:putative oxidoreductase